MKSLSKGTVLNVRYTIGEVKGSGAFGITYKGWDGAVARCIAIKECFPSDGCERDPETNCLIPANQEEHGSNLRELREEARTLAESKNPGVVAVHDIFAANNTLYIVMEWLPGESLQSIMNKIQSGEYAPVSQDKARSWLCYMLQALKGIHSKNIFHRDIKPDNIVFDEDGNPKLVDFGSALNRNTRIGQTIVGSYTPAYAAPEQTSGLGKMGPWTDFFALAATFYELLTGRPVRSDQEAELPYPLHLEHRLAESIMRNLQMDPRARCQNADEWLELLNASEAIALPVPAEQVAGEYSLGDKVGKGVADAINTAASVVETAGAAIGGTIGRAGELIAPVAQNIGATVGESVSGAITKVKGLYEKHQILP